MLLTQGTNNYVNDTNGNTLTGGGRTNIWDSQNRLVQCVNGTNTSSFVYAADGIRRQSTVNGTTTDFVVGNSMFVREQNHATGANIATYLVGIRGPEYRRDDTTGQVRWYVYDGLGSVLGEVDPNGNITSSRKYDVYGLVRGGNNPGGSSNQKFVGQLGHPSEDNTGMIYMRSRYYNPLAGRFSSEDPSKHGMSWFAYCHSNPVNWFDATGNEETVAGTEATLAADGFLDGLNLDLQITRLRWMITGDKGFISVRMLKVIEGEISSVNGMKNALQAWAEANNLARVIIQANGLSDKGARLMSLLGVMLGSGAKITMTDNSFSQLLWIVAAE